MYITKNCYEELAISLINKSTKAVIDNLDQATEIIFQFKDSLPGDPVIELTLTGGQIEIDTPSEGDIKIKIEPDDSADVTSGDKYVGCEIQYSATDIREVEITENGMIIETIEIKEERVT